MNPIHSNPRRAALALAMTAALACAIAPALCPSGVSAQQVATPLPFPTSFATPVTPATPVAPVTPATPATPVAPATPAPPQATPASFDTPSPAPTRPERHRGAAASSSDQPSPTPTPTSPAFSTLDGYWEVVLQTPTNYTYSSFVLHQAGDEITGTWNHDGKKLPLAGNYDGRQFKFVAQETAHTVTLAGYVEGATDMVGIVDDGTTKDDPPAFTASHRESQPVVVFPKRAKK